LGSISRKDLGADLKENLRIIEESCKLFSSQEKRVFYDAEHFFDGLKSNQIMLSKLSKPQLKEVQKELFYAMLMVTLFIGKFKKYFK
jgi:hypothetical protein